MCHLVMPKDESAPVLFIFLMQRCPLLAPSLFHLGEFSSPPIYLGPKSSRVGGRQCKKDCKYRSFKTFIACFMFSCFLTLFYLSFAAFLTFPCWSRISITCDFFDLFLPFQDLDPLIDGLYDARSKNPVSILFDKLHHPNADFMTEEPSVLTWKNNENSSFKHIVLGNGPPGGTWHRMSYSQYSLSLDYWLELPGYQFKQWQEEHNYKNEMSGCSCNLPKLTRGEGVHESRILPNHVAQYYSDYVKRMKLDSNFMNNVTVTSVKRMSPNNPIWTVCGVQYNTASGENEQLQFFARNVVLAVGGYSIPRMLNIPGEDEKFVRYQLPDLDDFLQEVDVKRMAPVVVVGCGLVALDAIIALMERRVPVFHVFRREAKDPKLIVNQLPSSYPDYLKLKPLMAGKSSNEYYTPFQQSRITEILPSNECTIEHVSGKSRVMVKTSQIVVQIGSKPNLSIMGEMRRLGEDSSREVDIKENPVDIDPFTYESTEAGLYAIGPLVGDNFVRFILGGALAIVSGLVQKNKPKSE